MLWSDLDRDLTFLFHMVSDADIDTTKTNGILVGRKTMVLASKINVYFHFTLTLVYNTCIYIYFVCTVLRI